MKINFTDKKNIGKDVADISLLWKNNDEVFISDDKKKINIGAGNIKKFNRRKLVILSRKIIVVAKKNKVKKIAVNFSEFILNGLNVDGFETAEILGMNFEMANFEFDKYKTVGKRSFVEEIFVLGGVKPDVKAGFKKGQLIGIDVNECRALSNTPGGDMTPALLAAETEKIFDGTKAKVKIIEEKEMLKLKMGGILGVSRGSSEKPKLIVVEYKNGGDEKPIVLIGKGITFDSGGINLKPEKGLNDMHLDMSGGSAVIFSLAAAVKLGIKKNIIVIVPAVENMPSGSSYRPGDILKMMSGKTVEVMNTDAEGRITLADALTYAGKYEPRLVVDVATLTGSALAALGQRASVILTKKKELEKLFCELGEKSGDYVWPLPLWDEYRADINGTFGDLSNVGKTSYGGAITAAMFLYQFAKKFPWVHIDMASRMVSVEGEYLAKGAAGAPVRLLVKLLESF